MSTFVLTMGTVAREAATFTFTGSGPFECTAAVAPTHTVVVGDTVIDDLTNEYLVTVVTSTTVYTVTDYRANGAPSDSPADSGTLGRAHPSLTEAEAEIGNYASIGDIVEVRCYNDGTLTSTVVVDDTTLTATGKLRITSPVGERHTGDAGTGFLISSASRIIDIAGAFDAKYEIDHLEMTMGNSGNSRDGVRCVGTTGVAGEALVDSMIIHDGVVTGSGTLSGVAARGARVTVRNCLIYDLDASASSETATGIITNSVGDNSVYDNNTIERVTDAGILTLSSAVVTCNNNAVFGSAVDFTLAGVMVGANNASSDGTADDGALTGGIVDLTAANEFKNLTDGNENYRIPGGGALLNAGTDLSGTFTVDITGAKRAVPFDIGAYEFKAPGGGDPFSLNVASTTLGIGI